MAGRQFKENHGKKNKYSNQRDLIIELVHSYSKTAYILLSHLWYTIHDVTHTTLQNNRITVNNCRMVLNNFFPLFSNAVL